MEGGAGAGPGTGVSPGSRRLRFLVLATAVLLFPAGPAAPAAEGDWSAAVYGIFPEATRVGPLEGDPPAAAILAGERKLGYALLTDRIVDIPGYSGRPISTLVGLDMRGRMTGARIVAHREPILGAGVKESELRAFVRQYRGLFAGNRTRIGGPERPGYVRLDGLSGATITAMALDSSIEVSARKVARSRGLQVDVETRGGGTPPWVDAWRSQRLIIGLFVAGLAALIVVLVFQDWLVRRPRLMRWVRRGFLGFTILVVGWWGLAQLSVVNVFTFFHALTGEFRWETFLADPLIFILWSFVAVSLLLWGRGVYCGWLCPYGALQELASDIGRALKLPRLELPAVVHERLWALKYVIFLVLFGLSLEALDMARPYTEVEPFRTVFGAQLQREWPFVAYAVGLIVVSAFNTKFYCKYLCPLGAALAIPARVRLLDWLRRRKECGNPCQLCALQCDVRAVRETGEINPAECHYCLDCQVIYWDRCRCPPLIAKMKRQARLQREGAA